MQRPHFMHIVGFGNRTAVSELPENLGKGLWEMYVVLSFYFVYCNIKYNIINSTDLYMASFDFGTQIC